MSSSVCDYHTHFSFGGVVCDSLQPVYYLLEKKRMPPVEVHIDGTSSVASALYAMGKVFLSEMENDAEHAEPANGCDAELLGGCNY